MQQLRIPTLPLAVYQEVAAHLEQIQGVSVGLTWDNHTRFDYLRSQIGGLTIQHQNGELHAEQRIQAILNFYGERYGPWE